MGRTNELITFFVQPGKHRGEAWPGLPLREGDSMGYILAWNVISIYQCTGGSPRPFSRLMCLKVRDCSALRVIPLMSFLSLHVSTLPPKHINSTDGQWKCMQGETGRFSLQALTKLQKHASPWGLDLDSGRKKPSQGFL